MMNPALRTAGRTLSATDEAEIQQASVSFAKAYNTGNSEAVAALFTPDAEVLGAQGTTLRGRRNIKRAYAGFFEANPGARITIDVKSVRLVAPDTAVQDNVTTYTPPLGSSQVRRYTVTFVKRDGRWLIASRVSVQKRAPQTPST
jgi:uncharacterized protein (TIGR02246 family)